METISLVTGIIVLVGNAVLSHYGDKKGILKALHLLVDILSPLTRRDSPGTLKLPGTVSKKP